ncbi:meprin A subunit beta-like [Lycorma delicatula]|uniref:meprin A subunit beta-like n=1 Tax=Lycorma delicatula TaxID=130591 RepID=UPI003F50D8B4
MVHHQVFFLQKKIILKGFIIIWTAMTTLGVPVKHTYSSIFPFGTNKVVEGGKFQPIPPGTDRGLYNINLFEGDIYQPENNYLRNAIKEKDHLWQYGVVIYKVDDDVGCPESPQCEILYKAMNHYHSKSCIRFKEWTGEENYIRIFFNLQNSAACWSQVGRAGGEQQLSLGERCWYLGIVIHELGHSLGFLHEMNRPDRDGWINIYWNNITDGFRTAFLKQDPDTVNTLGESFDYKSIMMYDEYAFSKDGVSPTLQATTSEEIGPIWKKRGLSESDIRRLQRLYECNENNMKIGFPYDIACDFNTHMCGFKNGPTSAWHWKIVNDTDGYVYTSYSTAGNGLAQFISVNFHPANALENKDSLGCVRFSYLLQGDGKSSLKLFQAYLKKVTQLNPNQNETFELWMDDKVSNEWKDSEISFIITRPFKLIFQSQFEDSGSYGNIILDDIEILYTSCNNDTAMNEILTTSVTDCTGYETGVINPTTLSSTTITDEKIH